MIEFCIQAAAQLLNAEDSVKKFSCEFEQFKFSINFQRKPFQTMKSERENVKVDLIEFPKKPRRKFRVQHRFFSRC